MRRDLVSCSSLWETITSPNRKEVSSPELSLTTDPAHSKGILISLIRKRGKNKAFFGSVLPAHHLCECMKSGMFLGTHTFLDCKESYARKNMHLRKMILLHLTLKNSIWNGGAKKATLSEQHHATTWCELYLWRIKINTIPLTNSFHTSLPILIWDSFMIKSLRLISA